MNEDEIYKELWLGCGEQLELMPKRQWGALLAPVLVKMLVKERQDKEYFKKRLENVCVDTRK